MGLGPQYQALYEQERAELWRRPSTRGTLIRMSHVESKHLCGHPSKGRPAIGRGPSLLFPDCGDSLFSIHSIDGRRLSPKNRPDDHSGRHQATGCRSRSADHLTCAAQSLEPARKLPGGGTVDGERARIVMVRLRRPQGTPTPIHEQARRFDARWGVYLFMFVDLAGAGFAVPVRYREHRNVDYRPGRDVNALMSGSGPRRWLGRLVSITHGFGGGWYPVV